MAAEESLKSKRLYKIELYTLKIIPIALAVIYSLGTVLSYFNIDLYLLSYLGGISFIPLLFLYISSYVFKFCEYHRMFLHYLLVHNIISWYDQSIGISISDKQICMLYLIISAIIAFVSLYLYLQHDKTNKKVST